MYGFITFISCGHPLSIEMRGLWNATPGWVVTEQTEHNPVCYCLSLLAVATVRYALQSPTISTVSVYETLLIGARGLKSARALASDY